MVIPDEELAQDATAAEQLDGPLGVWISGFGHTGDQDGKDGFTGYDSTSAGATIGFDQLLGEGWIAGVSLGETRTNVDMDHSVGRSDIDTVHGSIYSTWFDDDSWVDASVSLGLQDYDSRRRVTVGGFQETASSDHDGDLIAASIGGGLQYDCDEEWKLEPFGSLRYVRLDEDGFSESGAAPVNLTVGSRTTDALVSDLGVRYVGNLRRGESTYVPSIGAAWVHDFQTDSRSIDASFVGAPGGSFSLDGLDPDPDRLRVESGLGILRKNALTSLDLYGEFSGDYDAYGLVLSIRVTF